MHVSGLEEENFRTTNRVGRMVLLVRLVSYEKHEDIG